MDKAAKDKLVDELVETLADALGLNGDRDVTTPHDVLHILLNGAVGALRDVAVLPGVLPVVSDFKAEHGDVVALPIERACVTSHEGKVMLYDPADNNVPVIRINITILPNATLNKK